MGQVPSAQLVEMAAFTTLKTLTMDASSQATGALTAGKTYTILVSSDNVVQFRWGATADTATTSDPELPASGRYDFTCTTDALHWSFIGAAGFVWFIESGA
ncbi:MAG: hypothetical protein GY944_24460 [bacterium]|nr:hypothetical protein [bacterium]